MKPSGPGLLFTGNFLFIANSVSLLVIDLFRFPISFWFSLENRMSPEICAFLLVCLILCWWVWLKTCQLHLFQEQALSFSWSSLLFLLVSVPFISTLFVVVSILLTLGFVCSSFPSSSSRKLRLFVLFPEVGLYCYKLSCYFFGSIS